MNLLIFVTVLLMVLASMSYGDLKIFYSQVLSQSAWVRYMEEWETCTYNEAVSGVYDALPKKKGEPPIEVDSVGNPMESGEKQEETESKPGEAKKQRNDSSGSARINFHILVGQQKNVDPKTYEQLVSVMKNLITQIYGEQDFFKKAKQERPNLLDDLFAALKEFSDGKKIEYTKDLGKLKLTDPVLESFFYTLLRKTPVEGAKKVCEEVSLFQFLSEGRRQKIHVNLSPKPILLAIFGKEETVDQLIKDSDDLYKEVSANPPRMKSEDATKQLEATYGKSSDYSDILDFTVNKTKPKQYR